MKKTSLIVIVCIGIIIFISFPWLYYRSMVNKASIGEPAKKNGEFPFKLVYRINDEVVTIEDTFICEYKGAKWNWNIGGYRVWKGYIESTGEDMVHVMNDGEYNIVITVGFAEYYMGLAPSSEYPWTPQFVKTGPQGSALGLSYEEALSQYGIEILSFEHTDPIGNIVSD